MWPAGNDSCPAKRRARRADRKPSPPDRTAVTLRRQTFDIDCRLAYDLPAPVDFLFQIHALQGVDQVVETEALQITRSARCHVFEDPQAHHRFLRVRASAGPLALRYRARVRIARPLRNPRAVEHPIAELPDHVLHNLMPTRYCESDLLAPAALKLFGGLKPGASRVQAVCDWIHRNVEYRVGSSNSTTTARDVFVQRAGVCRDFSHLAVTFCRALNIPARLAVGYAYFDTPPPDFHAMFEAYLGGRWELFDPSRMASPYDLVRIAGGRDAKDVAFATIFGAATSKSVLPYVERV